MGCPNSKEEKTLKTAAFSFNIAMDKSLEKEDPKNPMLLSPVIRCVREFVNIKDIKNCRLVSREWGSVGKIALANRGLISFVYQRFPCRLPVDFYSCFLHSATLFSAFKISVLFSKDLSGPWMINNLTRFFDKQEKHIKELTLKFRDVNFVSSIDLSSWISKSAMVQKDANYLTKLSIMGDGSNLDIPLHLIANIKDLTLSHCKINLETGIKICSTKLKLQNATFYQNGIKLDNLRINDIVEFRKVKEVSLDSHCWQLVSEFTKYILDLEGRISLRLDFITLEGVEIVNGESSQWVVENLSMTIIPYSLNSEMKIKVRLNNCPGSVDLLMLPKLLEKLALNIPSIVNCNQQPLVLEKLQYLHILQSTMCYYSFLSHFKNCPQLIFLKIDGCDRMEIQSIWKPISVKTLSVEGPDINWLLESCIQLEKLVLHLKEEISTDEAKKLFKAKITVDDVILIWNSLVVNKHLIEYLEYRENCNFGKRLYIGQLKWGEEQLEDSLLKEHVDVKSEFYVFEIGRKGCAISKNAFYELVPFV